MNLPRPPGAFEAPAKVTLEVDYGEGGGGFVAFVFLSSRRVEALIRVLDDLVRAELEDDGEGER